MKQDCFSTTVMPLTTSSQSAIRLASISRTASSSDYDLGGREGPEIVFATYRVLLSQISLHKILNRQTLNLALE